MHLTKRFVAAASFLAVAFAIPAPGPAASGGTAEADTAAGNPIKARGTAHIVAYDGDSCTGTILSNFGVFDGQKTCQNINGRSVYNSGDCIVWLFEGRDCQGRSAWPSPNTCMTPGGRYQSINVFC